MPLKVITVSKAESLLTEGVFGDDYPLDSSAEGMEMIQTMLDLSAENPSQCHFMGGMPQEEPDGDGEAREQFEEAHPEGFMARLFFSINFNNMIGEVAQVGALWSPTAKVGVVVINELDGEYREAIIGFEFDDQIPVFTKEFVERVAREVAKDWPRKPADRTSMKFTAHPPKLITAKFLNQLKAGEV